MTFRFTVTILFLNEAIGFMLAANFMFASNLLSISKIDHLSRWPRHINDRMTTKFLKFQRQFDEESNSHKIQYKKLVTETTMWLTKQSSPQITNKSLSSYKIATIIEESAKYLSKDAIWEWMGEENEVKVWKLMNSSIKLKKDDQEWPCVKSTTVINIDADTLMEYLLDSAKVKEYNKYSAGRLDIELFSSKSKIVWNKMNIPKVIKPYDFCTLLHCYSNPSGNELILVSKCANHALVPVHKSFSRSEKIIGLNVLKKLPNDKEAGNYRTEITCISHQRYANTPVFMIEKSMMRGKVNYLRKLRDVFHSKSRIS
mmetsp:Transcript_1150/g.1306  ORF Transcript_1150/g.1306 Transcript_1150/m.1306 type:complete len:314 (+) Transcript_1150:200-1141(+)